MAPGFLLRGGEVLEVVSRKKRVSQKIHRTSDATRGSSTRKRQTKSDETTSPSSVFHPDDHRTTADHE
jgi:hypothetical protein